MATPNQLLKGLRRKKCHKTRSPLLKGNPQKKGVCVKIYDTKPKKPNLQSATSPKYLWLIVAFIISSMLLHIFLDKALIYNSILLFY